MASSAGILETLKEVVNGGDPTLREWFMMRSFTPVLSTISLYVLFVKVVGPALMSSRRPFKPVYLVAAYNFALVVFYISFIYRGFFYIPKLGASFFCGALNIRQGPDVAKLYELGHELYLVKYIELFDTVFLVLSKKFDMITNLHVFHHSVVPIFGFVGFRSETSSYLTVLMGFNSIIHIIMYTYYGIAVLGPRFQKYLWWKKYLTFVQMFQFLSVFIYIAIMSALGCTPSKTTLLFSTSLCIVFFFLFLNFFMKTFTSPKAEKYANGDLSNSKVPPAPPKCTLPLSTNGGVKTLIGFGPPPLELRRLTRNQPTSFSDDEEESQLEMNNNL